MRTTSVGHLRLPDDSTLDAMGGYVRPHRSIDHRPVYEGKSMAGLIDLSSAAKSTPASTVLTPTPSAASPRSQAYRSHCSLKAQHCGLGSIIHDAA